MMRLAIALCAALGSQAGSAFAEPLGQSAVIAEDGVRVFVYEYRATALPEGLPLLMFHMAGGDARGEFDEIAQRLAAEGRWVFTADLRGGGAHFRERDPAVAAAGYVNQTSRAVENAPLCDAYLDVNAALSHVAEVTGRRVIVMGSSYSAALVVQLAARRPEDVAGYVAFSPASGEPMSGSEPEPWLAQVHVPGWAVRPRAEATIDWIARQQEIWAQHGAPMDVYDLESHGASILLDRRAGGDCEPVWDALHRFLYALGPDRQIEVSSGGWSLRGDFRRGFGEGARPAVLLLNSTAGDRRVYERLASELARLGISSLRVDLRGHGESVNFGRFDPEAPDLALINEAWRDVNAAFAMLRSMPDIDQARLGVVGAGYSGEAMAEAARRANGYARAYVALSPGSFSETSAGSIDASGADWLLLYSSEERFAPRAVERARVLSRTVEINIVPGLGHGSDLLRLTPATPVRLAHWLAEALGGEA